MTPREVASLRAEALFVSPVQRSDSPTCEQVRAAITASLLQHGPRGCACRLAQEYGEHPVEAALRMSWALAEVAIAYHMAAPQPVSA
jgi:hypothetical protein